ncbi:MAG: hypothetical protein AB7F78_05465 [Hyphomicrobiaceae bacterium]
MPAEAKDKPREKTERELDKALKDTFPASDPIPPSHETGAEDKPGAPIDRRPAEVDHDLVDQLADELKREIGTKKP